MRLTEKENETLPIDVSTYHPNAFNVITPLPPYFHNKVRRVCLIFIVIWFCPVADCITDPIIVCDDLLWNCPHCWRVQRHGRLLRAEKQVS